MSTDTDAPDYWDSLRPQPPTDTDALLATVRGALLDLWATTPSLSPDREAQQTHTDALTALASLAAELKRLQPRMGGGDDYRLQMLSDARERMHAAEDELERVKAERDEALREADIGKWPKEAAQEFHRLKFDNPRLQARLDEALALLREITERPVDGLWSDQNLVDRVRAEIEGEQPS